MHSEISLTLEMVVESRYSRSLMHIMIQWSPGINTMKFLSKSVYTSMDLRTDRKR